MTDAETKPTFRFVSIGFLSVSSVALVVISLLASRYFTPSPFLDRATGWALVAAAMFLAGTMVGLAIASKQRMFVLVVVVLAIGSSGLIGYVGYLHYSSGPTLAFDETAVTLTVPDVEGRHGHLIRNDELLILRDGLDVFWLPNVGAAGERVENFQVRYVGVVLKGQTGVALKDQTVKERAKGLYDVRTVVYPPLHAGDKLQRTFEFDVLAAPSKEDGYVLSITAETHYAQVIMAMPEGRPCRTARVQVGGRLASPAEPIPQVLEEGRRVVRQKQNPEVGKEYLILSEH